MGLGCVWDSPWTSRDAKCDAKWEFIGEGRFDQGKWWMFVGITFRDQTWQLNIIYVYIYMGMDQYLLIPFLVGWTSIYQLFWCSPGVHTAIYTHIYAHHEWENRTKWGDFLSSQVVFFLSGYPNFWCLGGFFTMVTMVLGDGLEVFFVENFDDSPLGKSPLFFIPWYRIMIDNVMSCHVMSWIMVGKNDDFSTTQMLMFPQPWNLRRWMRVFTFASRWPSKKHRPWKIQCLVNDAGTSSRNGDLMMI